MKFIDIHTHTQFVAFDEDREEVMARAEEAEVGQIVVGTQRDTSQAAIHLARTYPHTYATVGLHPIHTAKSYHDEEELGGGEAARAFSSRGEVFDVSNYREIAQDPKTVAIGECGLDYFRIDKDTKDKQVVAFETQIALANEVQKPLMLHIRDGRTSKDSTGDAYRDALQILKRDAKVRGNVHFFAGSIEIAREFLEMGFTLSFTGVVTFTHDYDEILRFAPLDMIMAETDAPYVAPVPYRGKRNEPSYVKEIVQAIATARAEDPETFRQTLLTNAIRTFNLPTSIPTP
ncbi:MAG: hydrolase TatD [Candidatus Vogelbacteria bacterium CG10_big_fil_rev_8_21_14_0_10_45_14]|uniref:Hydrolase TatD n=1 Tax=Candidatus Vogelbacteria bacterium CG10_big_fil_rev_8_21_14_0_10_45_14 TaxID=1975042 RepID=A0A2H0RK48_9BACT|nr:MAG: hydrolase TatD [Candidatus Vogelbacteria bacterium CG10_big_fil_rev_8_21_14_0_10_45_14]